MISDDLRAHLLGKTDALGKFIAREMPPPEGCDDWEYRDVPWTDRAIFAAILSAAGAGEFYAIAMSRRDDLWRGQFWVSPTGCDRLKRLSDERPS